MLSLDAEALALFARKGLGAPAQAGAENGPKVRRILQLTRDLSKRPLADLRVLDLGCGEGVYAIEAALHGAEVVAIDGRTERMRDGIAIAERHGIAVAFEQGDVRRVTPASHGRFDVVWALGILYHLDPTEVLGFLEGLRSLCRHLLLVDTFLADPHPTIAAESAPHTIVYRERSYAGERWREHGDADGDEVRRGRVLRSLDNTFGFRFERSALLRALADVGFATVLECHVPAEPGKPGDRVTLAALGEDTVEIATYPGVNGVKIAPG